MRLQFARLPRFPVSALAPTETPSTAGGNLAAAATNTQSNLQACCGSPAGAQTAATRWSCLEGPLARAADNLQGWAIVCQPGLPQRPLSSHDTPIFTWGIAIGRECPYETNDLICLVSIAMRQHPNTPAWLPLAWPQSGAQNATFTSWIIMNGRCTALMGHQAFSSCTALTLVPPAALGRMYGCGIQGALRSCIIAPPH